MAEFQTVAQIGDIPRGEGRSYALNGRMVGVFHTDDGFYAIDDICPHMGALLSSGAVEGNTVMCPWHAWSFSVCDGSWLDAPKSKVRAEPFELRIVDGAVQVLVPDPPGQSGAGLAE